MNVILAAFGVYIMGVPVFTGTLFFRFDEPRVWQRFKLAALCGIFWPYIIYRLWNR